LQNDGEDAINTAINVRSKEASLPPNLPTETFQKLPELTGVYFMHNEEGKVVYVGKAKEIRTRIMGHFADNTVKKLKMKQEIFDISFELTGTEFLALVVEAAAIKHFFPKFNRAQKYSGNGYVICEYEDQKNVLRLDVAQNKKYTGKTLAAFSSIIAARSFLKNLSDDFSLCPKMMGLQNTDGGCFDFQLKKCLGVCCGEESAANYNQRVRKAIASFDYDRSTYLVWLKGRKRDERAFIYIENGQYKGYGFVHEEAQLSNVDDLLDVLIQQKHNPDIQHILRAQLPKIHKKNIVRFEVQSI
jgi:DNA polymerase-3 subunit epsilon